MINVVCTVFLGLNLIRLTRQSPCWWNPIWGADLHELAACPHHHTSHSLPIPQQIVGESLNSFWSLPVILVSFCYIFTFLLGLLGKNSISRSFNPLCDTIFRSAKRATSFPITSGYSSTTSTTSTTTTATTSSQFNSKTSWIGQRWYPMAFCQLLSPSSLSLSFAPQSSNGFRAVVCHWIRVGLCPLILGCIS